VCGTDTATVEIIIKEIFANLALVVRQGQPIRMNFKVGQIIIRNNLIKYKPESEESNRE
jgi:hypothetical protein